MAPPTPNLGLARPDDGNNAWGPGYRAAMDTIDTVMHGKTTYVDSAATVRPATDTALFGVDADSTLAVDGDYRIRLSTVAQGGVGINVADYGALGDGTTDDGPAFNAAFAEARTRGKGSTIEVPAGHFRIATPVLANNIGQVAMRGNGGESRIRIQVGSGQTGLNFNSNHMVHIEGVLLTGTAGQSAVDAFYGLDLQSVARATIEFCAVEATLCGDSTIHADATRLTIRDTQFGATGGNTTSLLPTVRLRGMRSLDIENVYFFDYGVLTAVGTPRNAPWAWMIVQAAAAPASAWEQSTIKIKGLQMDEGARWGLRIQSGANRYRNVHLQGVTGNLAGAADAGGVFIDGTERLVIEGSQYGYMPALNPKRPGFRVENTTTALLRGVRAFEGADRIELASTVGYAEVSDCVYGTLQNSAATSDVWSGRPPYGVT